MLGVYLAAALFVSFAVLFISESRRVRAIIWGGVTIMLFGLLFSFSKAAILGFCLGLIFIFLFILVTKDTHAKSLFYNGLFIIALVFGVFLLGNGELIQSRMYGAGRLEVQSFEERIDALSQARNLIQETWISGVGINQYTLAMSLREPGLESWQYQPVHNVFVLVLAELGIGGLLIFLLLLFEIIRTISRFKLEYAAAILDAMRKFNSNVLYGEYVSSIYWLLSLTSIIILFLVIFLFDHFTWTLYGGSMLWWLFFGLWMRKVGENKG
jgi:hypothetical protein